MILVIDHQKYSELGRKLCAIYCWSVATEGAEFPRYVRQQEHAEVHFSNDRAALLFKLWWL